MRLSLLAGGLIIAEPASSAPPGSKCQPSLHCRRAHVGQSELGRGQLHRRVRSKCGRRADADTRIPFPGRRRGLGTGLGSQGGAQASPNGRYLLAIDAGSIQISVLRVTPSACPSVPAGPLLRRGEAGQHRHQPVRPGLRRQNGGYGGSNYTGFLSAGGQLIPLPHTTVPVPEGSGVGMSYPFHRDRLVGTRRQSLADRQLRSPVRRSPRPRARIAVPGSGSRADRRRVPADQPVPALRHSNAGAGDGTVSAFPGQPRGALRSIGKSPVADGQTGPHAGSRSLTTAGTCSPSTPARATCHGTRSRGRLAGSDRHHRVHQRTRRAGGARLSPDGRTLSVMAVAVSS